MRGYTSEQIRELVTRPAFEARVLPHKDLAFPQISIVTPSFNQRQFLERTILSVVNQNYPNLEYIIIDGGSTDGSVEIIRRYERYLAYWVSEKDSGQSEALNKGFSQATGEYIGWQNSDDIYLPGAFYTALQVFKDDPATEIAFANRLDVDEQDNIIGESRFVPFSVIGHWYEGMSLSNQSTFWRRALFERIGLIDPRLQVAMDYEFFLRAGRKGARFNHLPYYWGAIRRHKASKASRLSSSNWKQECNLIDRCHGRRPYLNVPFMMYSSLRRALYYLLQGDRDYLINGLKRRTQFPLRRLLAWHRDKGQ